MKEFFVIAAMLLYAGLCYLAFPVVPIIDYSSLISEGAVALILCILIFSVRSARDLSQSAYGFFQMGVFSLLLAVTTDTLEAVLVMPFWASIFFDDFPFIIGFLLVLLGVRDWIEKDRQLKDHLYKLSTTDDLTGLLNRRAFLERASQELLRAERYSRSFSLIMLDIDHFKLINDSYGHLIGDEVLRRLAQTITYKLRKTECVARWGGEEFLLLILESDRKATEVVVERLREGIESTVIDLGDKRLRVTVSLGVTVLEGEENTVHELIDQADKALYDAKNAGRNCVRWSA